MLSNLEVLRYMQTEGKTATVNYLVNISKEKQLVPPSDGAVYNKLSKFFKKYESLKKNKNRPSSSSEKQIFDVATFEMPIASTNVKKSNTNIDNVSTNCDSSTFANATLRLTTQKLAVENINLKQKKCEIEIQNTGLKKEVKSVKTVIVRTSIPVLKAKINRLESESKSKKKENKCLNLVNTSLKARVNTKVKVIKQTSLKLKYYQTLVGELRNKINEKDGLIEAMQNQIEQNSEQIKTLNTEKNDTIAENDWLRELIDDEMVSFDGYKYSAGMQMLIFELVSCHVSTRKIPIVINAVLKLVGKRVSHIPSRSCINNMSAQMLSLSQNQLGEEFSEKQNTTLLSDETTKYDKRVEGIHASDVTGREWVLGLREIETKSADNVMKVFKQILNDIDSRSEVANNEKSKNILGHIVAKMSDRAATELKLGKLIEEVRKEILPEVMAGYEELNDGEKSDVGQLLVFSCGLHSLVHFAECCNVSLMEAEKGMFPEKVPATDPFMNKPSESATCRLVRTCSKAFARGGDAKNGVNLEFSAYVQPFLKEKKLHTLPLAPYRGSRFNILFANASHVFFLRIQFISFLDGRENNRLLKSVLHDLKCPEFISGCKALGLISKYVTTPLWSLIEDKSIHVMDMSIHYINLVESLEYAVNHLNEFLEGKIMVFGDITPVNRDSCLDELLKPFEHDDIVQSLLLVIIPAMIKLCKKLFADHLTDGKFTNVEQDSDSYDKTKSVPKHNKFAESIFAYMDCLMKARPNVSLLTCEALIMFAKNKTAEWLAEKGDKDTAAVLAHARKSREQIAQDFRRRQREIKEARRLETLRKQQEAERKRQDRLRKLEGYTDSITIHGLWQSLEQVDELLLLYKSKYQKIEALKAQIYFREHVLGQKPADKKLLLKSASLEQMTVNVKKLIEDAGSTVENSERHMLVGKKIRHRQQTEEDGVKCLKWFEGKVCSQVTGYPAWFNVKYRDDDAIYTYRLGEDLERGDVQILVLTT